MQNRSLWKLLASLEKQEKEKFRTWLQCELGNKQAYVQALLATLLQTFPNVLSKEQVWAALYPRQAFDDARLRKLIRDLTEQLEEFLAIQSFRKDRLKRDVYLVKAVNQRNLPDAYDKIQKRVHKKLEKRPFRDVTYFRTLRDLAEENQYFFAKHKYAPSVVGVGEQGEINWNDRVSFALDGQWLYEKLILMIQAVSTGQKRRALDGHAVEETWLKVWERQIDLQQSLNLSVFFRLYQLLKKGEDKEAEEVRTMVFQNKASFSESELKNIGTILINHWIRVFNQNPSQEAANNIYTITTWGVEEGFILVNGVMPDGYYSTLIRICLRVNDFDNAWKYLHEFKVLLVESLREPSYNFNLACYYFSLKDFDNSIRLLRMNKYPDLNLEIFSRLKLLQAHFEQNKKDEKEWLIVQIESFIRYLKKRIWKPRIKMGIMVHLRLLQSLIKAHTSSDYAAVLKRIRQEEYVYNKEWLLEKVNQYI